MTMPRLDDDFTVGDAPPVTTGRSRAQMPKLETLPDIYSFPQKKRLPPMVVAGIGFAAATALLFGAERFLPHPYKPSDWMGGYASAMIQARKEGELAAQIRYDAQVRQVEVQYQTQLKEIESAANAWQEQYKTALTGYVEHYRATWNRANIYAQATADIQKQYVAARTELAGRTVRGQVNMANDVTTIGLLLGWINPELERQSLNYADRVRQQALAHLDSAAQGGVTISIDGWNDGLVDPQTVARDIQTLPPFSAPRYEWRPIIAPAQPADAVEG
jgi:hypothetical protein